MARSTVPTTLVIIVANFVMLSFFYFMFATTGGASANSSPLPSATAHSIGPRPPRQTTQLQVDGIRAAATSKCDCPPPEAQTSAQDCTQCPCPPSSQQLTAPAPVCPPPPPCDACEACDCPKCPAVQAVAPSATLASSQTAPKRNAVLGLAKGIDFEFAYRFVRSLRTAAPTVDIIIFTDRVSDELREMYDAFGVTLSIYNVADLGVARKYHPSSYRWIIIDDYLRALAQPYDAVMFVDTRDAVFQSDPFEVVTRNAFYATLEAKPRTIRECGWNRKWVSDCFGTDILSVVGDKVISCSGTSIAAWEPALEYTALMKKEIVGNPCERNGVDQGMHNVFVHANRLQSEMVILTNEEGPIATVQNMKTLNRDRFGRLLNSKGQPYAVVHQYDRSAALKRQYAKQYLLLDERERRRRD